MKIAKVIPLYKNKEKNLMTNFRPISLLSALSKLLEKVIHKRLYGFLQSNDRLYKHHYGFRKKHSTTDTVTQFINDTLLAYDNNEYTLAVLLDLSKAFDTIDHVTLLKKLEHNGIRGLALKWFESYLKDRKQCVCVIIMSPPNSVIYHVVYLRDLYWDLCFF